MKRSPALLIARRGLLAIVCFLPALAAAIDVPPWPTLGGDMQRTGLSPYPGPSIGCVKWRFQTAEEPEFPSLIYPAAGVPGSVAIDAEGRILFACEDEHLYALDAEGQLLWKHRFEYVALETWHWPMNEGDGDVVHAAAGGYDGSLHGFADPDGQWVVDDRFGHVLSFDGTNDFVQIDGFAGIDAGTARRVSFWVWAAGGGPVVCWGREGTGEDQWAIYVTPTTVRVHAQGQTQATVMMDDGWHYVEVLFGPGALRTRDIEIRIDNEPVSSTVLTEGLWVETFAERDVCIGRHPVTGEHFQGRIADVKIEHLKPVSGTVGGPTVAPDGTIYALFSSTLHAIAPDGTGKWAFDTGGFAVGAPAVDAEGRVYFGSADGKVYAVGPDGAKLWDFEVPGAPSGAVIAPMSLGLDGSVYVGGVYHSTLYALDPADGSIRWECDLSGPEEDDTKCFVAAPVVGSDGTVYVTLRHDSKLYAIDPETGEVAWATELWHEPELVSYWNLDVESLNPTVGCLPIDQTGIRIPDSSPYARDARTTTTAMWINGIHGSALWRGAFRVDDFVWPAGTRARTFAAWLRPRPLPASESIVVQWAPKEGTGESCRIIVTGTSDPASGAQVRAEINGGYLQGHSHLMTTYQWHHIAVVIEDGEPPIGIEHVKIYVDGVLDADAESNSGMAACSRSIGIKPYEDQPSTLVFQDPSRVALDDVRLYRAALTPEQIMEVMASTTGPTWADPEPDAPSASLPLMEDGFGWMQPAVGPDGTIYVGADDGYLRAVRPDGTLRWVKHLGFGSPQSCLASAEGWVYVTGMDGEMVVLAADGRFVSQLDTSDLVSRLIPGLPPGVEPGSTLLSYPVLGSDGTVYISDAYNRLWAIARHGCGDPVARLSTAAFDRANIQADLHVNLADVAVLAEQWHQCNETDQPCTTDPGWTYVATDGDCPYTLTFLGSDLNRDLYVDIRDLAVLVESWLLGD